MKRLIEFLFILTVAMVYVLPLFILYLSCLSFELVYPFFQLLGLIIFLTGVFFWIWGFISLGKFFNILPQPLGYTRRGIYKYLSHPIYTGIFLVFLGLSIAFFNFAAFYYTIFILLPFNLWRIKLENNYLKKIKMFDI